MTISARMLPHTITIVTPAEVDDTYGNKVLSYETDDGATSRTAAAYVRPAPAPEDTTDRDAVTSEWQVHTNDLGIGALDRITHDGTAYEVAGQPSAWATKPGGGAGHAKLQLRRVDG